MTNAPHVVGRSFEQLIMFPLGLVALLAGVAFLFGHEWALGSLLIMATVCIGGVGQSLPRRKK